MTQSASNSRIPCNANDVYLLRELESSLLDQLRTTYEKEKCISDDLLESLYFLYKSPLLEALNQIDKFEQQIRDSLSAPKLLVDSKANNTSDASGGAKCLATAITVVDGHRPAIYQVRGSLGINYYLFEDVNFCSCSSFKFNVLSKFEYIYCKHAIMVKLLKAMNKLHVRHVKEAEFVEFVKLVQ